MDNDLTIFSLVIALTAGAVYHFVVLAVLTAVLA